MKTLIDYLDGPALQHLQDAFSAVAGAPVRICSPAGEQLVQAYTVAGSGATSLPGAAAPAADASGDTYDLPVVVGGKVVGRVAVDPVQLAEAPAAGAQVARLLRLMVTIIERLCDREKQLRTRIEELATLYRLTVEFAGQRDIQALLDLVAETVVNTLGAKACSIRLLSEDGSELVIRAVAKLSTEYLNKGPILLSESQIDQEVLQTRQPVYIADERTDPRVLYPAEARREGIVSALCVPMLYHGHAEGVIRVYMAEQHEFDWFEVSLVRAIAGEAAAAIVNARLYEEAIRSAEIKRQLAMAGEVQRRMIPEKLPDIPGFELGAIYVPSLALGGDFYDFFPLGEDCYGAVICDVVGKGVRASLLMASIRASLRARAESIYDMSELLGRLNRDLCAETVVGDFATMFYAVLDFRNRHVTYANVGHTPPLLLRGGQARPLSTGGGVLGIEEGMCWQNEVIEIASGDVILAYTDGLSEALNFQDEPFGHARVEQAALAAVEMGRDAAGIAKHVLWEMRRFAGLQTRFDDLTLITIKAL